MKGACAVGLIVAAAGHAIVGGLSGCTESRRSLGEECIKSEDCLSGICEAMHCAAQPPLLDAAPLAMPDAGLDAASPREGGPGRDASSVDAGGANDATTPSDAATMDAGAGD